jgi:hypothetical protein
VRVRWDAAKFSAESANRGQAANSSGEREHCTCCSTISTKSFCLIMNTNYMIKATLSFSVESAFLCGLLSRMDYLLVYAMSEFIQY